MEDDSPVFSLVILAKEEWDKVITSNDLIRIKITPDSDKGEPDNPYIMVGMISDIHKEGEYSEGILLYRITGRGMAKALMDFEVGVIQEVSTVIVDLGWLPDDEELGLKFSGQTAADIAQELMEKFVYEYAKYNFDEGTGLRDYLDYEFNSWHLYERLSDVTPFINYQGSIRQFLEDIAAKPFNELFFDFTKDGKCRTIMRKTPFDPDLWENLRLYNFTSDIVIEESFGKTDAEMFSVFVVQAPNILEFNSIELGVYPQFNENLIEKYGYKRIDAENRYLLSSGLANIIGEQEDRVDEDGEMIMPPPDYEVLLEFITENDIHNLERLRKNPQAAQTMMLTEFPNLTGVMASGIVASIIDEDFTKERYVTIALYTGDEETDREINEEREVAGEALKEFTKKLFNWYCENANFYSGDIRVLGSPTFRLGSRLRYLDAEHDEIWEFYLEAVQHEFSFTSGYTTILGVTRGLPEDGKNRFTNLWGTSEDFKGGYLGEKSMEDMMNDAQDADSDYGGYDNDGSREPNAGTNALASLQVARNMVSKSSVYDFGGGRGSTSPFNSSPIRVDCSSFVWWCYYEQGISLKGGKTGMTTDTIKVDPQMKVVSARGSSSAQAIKRLRVGDIVYFDTYKTDGHLGIYSGGGKFVGAQSSTGIAEADMNSSYWSSRFKGHVIRYKESNIFPFRPR